MRRVRLGQARFSVTVEILEASWPPREAGERFERPASAPRLLFIHLTDAAQRWNSKCARVHKVPEKCVESARNASTRGRSGDDRRPSIPPSPFLPRTCAHRTILFKRDEKNRCRVAARLNTRNPGHRRHDRHDRFFPRTASRYISIEVNFRFPIFLLDGSKNYLDRSDCPGIGTRSI